MRFIKSVKNALLVNQVFAQERNCDGATNLGKPLRLTCGKAAHEVRSRGLRWPDGRPGGAAERSDNAPKTLRRLWFGAHEGQK